MVKGQRHELELLAAGPPDAGPRAVTLRIDGNVIGSATLGPELVVSRLSIPAELAYPEVLLELAFTEAAACDPSAKRRLARVHTVETRPLYAETTR